MDDKITSLVKTMLMKADSQLLLVQHLEQTHEAFEVLMKLFYIDDKRIQQTAASFLVKFLETRVEYIYPYLSQLVLSLKNESRVGVKRNTVRILQEKHFFDRLSADDVGILTDLCFEYLHSAQEPIAVKVFSMTILQYVVELYPELKQELKILIEDQMPYSSAGFKSRGKKVLNVLNTI